MKKKLIKIKENYIFRRAYNKGKSFFCPYFVVYVMKNRYGVRLGITAGKKLGGAVKRNRAKRVVAAAFRECLPFIKDGYDFVIVARTKILSIKSTTAAVSMEKLLISAGVTEKSETDEKTADSNN